MKTRAVYKILGLCTALLLLTAPGAYGMSSANNRIDQGAFNAGGGARSATGGHGITVDAIGQTVTGGATSANYKLDAGLVPTVTDTTPSTSALTASRASVTLNYNLARPATMTKVTVSSSPLSVSGSASTTRPWMSVSASSATTPSDLVININNAGLVARNYTGAVLYTSANGTPSPLRIPVSLTVLPASALTPENQHYNWDGSLTGGNCNICHITRGTFLPTGFNRQDSKEFCRSCHNLTSVAHEKGDNAGVHPIFVNVSTGGRNRWPSYGNITAAQKNNQPFARLKGGDTLVCETCHNVMGKQEDYGRVWEGTSTGDRYTYYMSYGGWANYGRMTPVVYRASSAMSAPTYSKGMKSYVVKPSEYTYDETAGSIAFTAQQSSSKYIYVTVSYPYLRASSEANRLCSDCHTQATHEGANCLTCHQAHNTANKAGIRNVVRTPAMSEKAVKFLCNTGANSFANGASAHDGICEVCHTKTAYYRNYSTASVNHSDGTNYNRRDCTACHSHASGF